MCLGVWSSSRGGYGTPPGLVGRRETDADGFLDILQHCFGNRRQRYVFFLIIVPFFAEKDIDMRHIMYYGKEYYIVARLITSLTRARGQRRYTRYTKGVMTDE